MTTTSTSLSQSLHGTAAASLNGKAIPFETERKFLTFSWYLLNVGWKRVVEQVDAAVRAVVGEIPLTESVSYEFFLEIIREIRQKIESGDQFTSLVQCLMPEEGQEAGVLLEGGEDAINGKSLVDDELKALLDEIRDFLESSDFKSILTKCFDTSFHQFSKSFATIFFPDSSALIEMEHMIAGDQAQQQKITEIKESVRIPMPKLIPAVSKMVHQIINGVPNAYVNAISSQPELKTYSAVVYTSWEE